MCSPVEHYFCFYLIVFLYEFQDVPRKISFRRCPQEKWFIFIILMFIVPASLSRSLPFVPVETKPDDYLVGKELVILLFECVVGNFFLLCFMYFLSQLVSMLGF